MEYHETYCEMTNKNGTKRWLFVGWNPIPRAKDVAKETKKFVYFDTPFGREKYRKQMA